MKKHNYLFPFVVVLASTVLLLAGCKRTQTQEPAAEDQPTAYELSRTGEDTLAVTQMVDDFFTHLEQGRVVDAVAMLYVVDNNEPYAEPQLLDNDQIREMIEFYSSFPIVSHHIDYIKFNQTIANEVKVSAVLIPAEGDEPEVSTAFYFRPYDYLTNWRLCVIDTQSGDKRVLTNEQADRLEEEFSQASN